MVPPFRVGVFRGGIREERKIPRRVESGTNVAGGRGNVFGAQRQEEEVAGRPCLSMLIAYLVSALLFCSRTERT